MFAEPPILMEGAFGCFVPSPSLRGLFLRQWKACVLCSTFMPSFIVKKALRCYNGGSGKPTLIVIFTIGNGDSEMYKGTSGKVGAVGRIALFCVRM